MRLGFVCSIVRREEKLLLEELARREVVVERFDDETLVLTLAGSPTEDLQRLLRCDVVWLRGVSQTRSLYLARVLETWGARCVNSASTIETCDDKVLTTLRLTAAGVPGPQTLMAFSETAGLAAVEGIGYPAVLKPVLGSWGRMLARLNDRDAAEALLETRATLGGPLQSVVYAQEHVEKPGRDIRAFVVGDSTICAIHRTSGHWVTNTARGAVTSNCPVGPELADLCERAAAAVGGGMLAIDIFESARGLLVNEVNATMEFRNSIEPTGVDIPALMVDYVLSRAAAGAAA